LLALLLNYQGVDKSEIILKAKLRLLTILIFESAFLFVFFVEMTDNELTDKQFWANYWESKKGLAFKVPENYTFYQIIQQITKEKKISSAIELGGFPGYYAIFLKKYFGITVSLLDYFIHPQILKEVLAVNNLDEKDVEVIEADLFNHQPTKQYDLVLSCGLIEHFKNTEDIIAKHIPFLNANGTLLITLPNFKGVNGWVQKTFDRYNFDKHVLECMDPILLAQIAKQLGLKNIEAYYFGRFSTWLENKEEKSFITKFLVRSIWYVGKIITRVIPVESKLFSPYIVLKANR
jgi:ubiquinone/menaquinone biosynthesis C-methylase UbiE